MIIVTSVSPSHKNSDNQHHAINSWRYGRCISFNTKEEIERLRTQDYKIEFIETNKTVFPLLSKPLVNINAIIDLAARLGEDLLLINSDIIIKELPELKNDGVTIFSRYDYETDMEENTMFTWGFDAAYIPKHLLYIFPPSVYALGACWWDLSVPLRAIQSGVPLYYPQGKFIFHKKHEAQWSNLEWERMGHYFVWEFSFDKKMELGQVATAAMNTIKANFIR